MGLKIMIYGCHYGKIIKSFLMFQVLKYYTEYIIIAHLMQKKTI